MNSSPKQTVMEALSPALREEFLEVLRSLGIVRDDDELIRMCALLSIVLRAFAREGESNRAAMERFIADVKTGTSEAKLLIEQLRIAGRSGVTMKAVIRAKIFSGILLAAFTAMGAFIGAKVTIAESSKELADMTATATQNAEKIERAAQSLAQGEAAVNAYNDLAVKYRKLLLMGVAMARVFNSTPKSQVQFFGDEIVVSLPKGMMVNQEITPDYDTIRFRRDYPGTGIDNSLFEKDLEETDQKAKGPQP